MEAVEELATLDNEADAEMLEPTEVPEVGADPEAVLREDEEPEATAFLL